MCTVVRVIQQNMRWYRVCTCVVQGWMYSSTCVGTGTVQGFPFFHDSPPSRGASDPSPGGQRSMLTARRVGHGTRYSPGTKKGCCVSGTWRHSEAAGGQVELETRRCFLGVLTKRFSKIHLDIITFTTEEHYIIRTQTCIA